MDGVEAMGWKFGWLRCCGKMRQMVWFACQVSHLAAIPYIAVGKQNYGLVLWNGSFHAITASGRWVKGMHCRPFKSSHEAALLSVTAEK